MDIQQPIYEVLLIGDSGNIKRNQPDEILELLKNHLPQNNQSAVIFLGDNVYPYGLPDESHPLRKDAETVLNAHYQAVENFKGKVIFISGNHDWNKGKSNGLSYVLRQEDYLNNLFKPQKVYFPENGCPGPTEIEINQSLVIIAINTQWWVQKGVRPIGKDFGCGQETEEDFFIQLEAMLEKIRIKEY